MITKWMYYYLLLSSKNNIWKMTVSLLTANNITSTVYEWLGYFISPYWWHTQLKHFWSKNHTATLLNYLTLTRKIQREWTLIYLLLFNCFFVTTETKMFLKNDTGESSDETYITLLKINLGSFRHFINSSFLQS
jgi:hypothetical protein